MKRKILFLTVFSGLSFMGYGQTLSPQVLASAGGYFTGGGNSLSWTMGETFTTTLQNGNIVLTQGQQQPYIELTLLNLKVFIEGFYTGGGYMDNYSGGGCLFVTGYSPNPLDADTITVSAMDAVTKSLVGSAKGIMKTDGSLTVKLESPVANGSSYYIKINHRNSIETWSASPVLFTGSTTYDFTTAASQAYGSNMIDIGAAFAESSRYAIFSGDISDAGLAMVGFQDGVVESQDYSDMENAVIAILIGYTVEDITGDGVVESADYSLMDNNVAFIRFVMQP
jgi:hypothetical protein